MEAPGSLFDVLILGDFGDIGFAVGGFDFTYDSSLASLENFEFALPVQGGSCPGFQINCPPFSDGSAILIWASFLPLIPPDSGPTLMGTITMRAGDEPGVLDLDMLNILDLLGAWFGTVNGVFMEIDPPDLIGTSVSIGPPQPVSAPATAWLILLAGLAAMRARRNARP